MKFYNNKNIKAFSVLALITMLTITTCGCNINEPLVVSSNGIEKEIEKAYPNLLSSESDNMGMVKDETVYIISDANGSTQKVIVNEWIKNGDGEETINDYSKLKNIENISGNEAFENNDGVIKWDAKGNDIKYQGDGEEVPPIEVKVKYYLNDELITPENILGKSGKVKIIFSYDINKKVYSNGYSIKAPYIMASALVLNNEYFSNIQVTNGNIVNDGNNSICLGLAFPSFNENLGTNLNFPETVEIIANTTNFQFDGSVSFALADINMSAFSSEEEDIDKMLIEFNEGIEGIQEASNKLLEGSDKLGEGAILLNTETSRFSEESETLANGSEELLLGIETLNAGINQLDSKSKELLDGAIKIQNNIFKTADEELRVKLKESGMTEEELNRIPLLTRDNYQEIITQITGSKPTEGQLENIESILREDLFINGITDEEQQNLFMSIAAYQLENQLAGNTKIAMDNASNIVKSYLLVSNVSKNEELMTMAGDDINQAIAIYLSNGTAEDINNKLPIANSYVLLAENAKLTTEYNLLINSIAYEELLEKSSEFEELLNTLNEVAMFTSGIKSYTLGVTKTCQGMNELNKGYNEFNNGLIYLNENAKKLESATKEMEAGCLSLSENLEMFNKEGIDKIISELDEAKLNDLLERFKAIKEASVDDYSYGGRVNEMDGTTKYIIKTSPVK